VSVVVVVAAKSQATTRRPTLIWPLKVHDGLTKGVFSSNVLSRPACARTELGALATKPTVRLHPANPRFYVSDHFPKN